ncbi:hypothetical protein HRG_002468 [Hirsutella rhossiliensis]|uniref:Myb-like domain-containing protein n=1 Tax=Hirsutella rhossiliensis TaxID=111463 RepID=A0A9P8N5A5_9HYPO|nr:uncharacterized protein HRG_02468 [Hirsutella rhossiliensis]KAH0967059.1 hypothetical protein HRG_02468 [Hirsutella rhossiliensis]
MAMSSKNWNDRADKDLFFTILSVKNIGVISGSEWATIGNHMRTLGYGFTNEGCRQHFQGLRRAQNKADANGVTAENAKRTDPTLNPITRRPGPGRGRPRKSQQDVPDQPNQEADAVPVSVPGQVSSPASRSFPGAVTGHFFGAVPVAAPDQVQQGQEPGPPQQPHEGPTNGQQIPMAPTAVPPDDPPGPVTGTPSAQPVPASTTQGGEIEEADVDADGAESAGPLEPEEQVEDNDEHPAKRQKLEPQVPDVEAEVEHEQALDDEAVLALAAHNGPSAADEYESEFDNYDEA